MACPTRHREMRGCVIYSRAAIVQKFSIQKTKNPAWPNLRSMGTPNARVTSEYQSESRKYESSAVPKRKVKADCRLSCPPRRSPFTFKIWKMEKVKVRSCTIAGLLGRASDQVQRDGLASQLALTKIIPTIVGPMACGTSNGSRSTCLAAYGDDKHSLQRRAVCTALALPACDPRKTPVDSPPTFARTGLTTARTAGVTLELAVICCRADAV